MRARRGVVLGSLVVGLYAAALVAVAVTTPTGALRPGDRGPDRSAASAFIDAWRRAGEATFVRHGTFERRSLTTGAVIGSEDVLVQRPPRRIHRQLGGVQGRDDDRLLMCPAGLADDPPGPCRLGAPAGPSFAESLADELAGLRSILEGSSPLYAVHEDAAAGCFDLAQQRPDPRAPFGREARFCFDERTGAPAGSRVRYAGGIEELVEVTEIRGSVTDADLEP